MFGFFLAAAEGQVGRCHPSLLFNPPFTQAFLGSHYTATQN